MSEPCRVITEEQYQDYLRSKEQINEANEIIIPAESWLNSHYKGCKLLKRNYVILGSLIRNIEIYCKKWGVK